MINTTDLNNGICAMAEIVAPNAHAVLGQRNNLGTQSGYAETDAPGKRAYLNSGVPDWFLVALFGPLGRRIDGCLASLPPGTNHLIDVGAGTGPMIWNGLASGRLPLNYTGFDPDPNVFLFSQRMFDYLAEKKSGEISGGAAYPDFGEYAAQLRTNVEKGHGFIAQAAKRKYMEKGFELTSHVLKHLLKFEMTKGFVVDDEKRVPYFSASYRYKGEAEEAPEHRVTYYNCELPVADPDVFGIKGADALAMVGITENFEHYQEFLDLTRHLVEQVDPKFIVFTALSAEKKGQVPAMIQKVMSQLGPGLFGAKAPKLHYHHAVESRTGSQLGEYNIRLVPQLGARFLVQMLKQ